MIDSWTNVAIYSGFRAKTWEYNRLRVHVETLHHKTLCGLNLRYVKCWERTAFPPDCRFCKQALEKAGNA